MTQLAQLRVKLTKKQLTELVKGKGVGLPDKVLNEKVSVLRGLLQR